MTADASHDLVIIGAGSEHIDKATGATRRVFDTIADNPANAGIVLGGQPVRPDAIDLRWVSALLHRNTVIEESGVATAVLNHPEQRRNTAALRLEKDRCGLGRVP